MNKVRNELKKTLNLQRRSLTSNGLVSLKGQKSITSLEEFGTQHKLKTLDLTDTSFETLKTLKGQPWLETLIVDKSPLKSYEGLSRHPQLREFSAVSTPLCERPNFRVAMLILVGPKLGTVNGTKIKRSERTLAASFPKIAKLLIEAGWDPSDKSLSKDEYMDLAEEYQVEYNGELVIDNEEVMNEMLKSPAVFLPRDEKEEKRIEQEKSAEYQSELESKDEELANEVAKVLASIGIRVQGGEKRNDEIIVAVSQLADLVKNIEDCTDEILGVEEEEDV